MSTQTHPGETIPRNPFVSDRSREIRRRFRILRFHYITQEFWGQLSQEDRDQLTQDYDAWAQDRREKYNAQA